MKDSVPGRDVQDEAVVAQNLFAASVQQRYKDVLDRMAAALQGRQEGPQQPIRTSRSRA